MSAARERAVSVIKVVDGQWVAKIYGVTGKRRRLAITATGWLDHTRRVSALYGALTLELGHRPMLEFHGIRSSKAANDCEVFR